MRTLCYGFVVWLLFGVGINRTGAFGPTSQMLMRSHTGSQKFWKSVGTVPGII